MIANDKLANMGGGGSYSTTDDNDDSGGSASVTSISDPVFGSGSGGKTGSETIAEGGAPESTVTNDPKHDSVSDKYSDPKSAFDDMVERAHDADDGSTATFDSTPDTQEGRDAIQDSVSSIVEATSGGNDQQTPENTPDMNLPTEVPELPFGRPVFLQSGGGAGAKALLVAGVALVAALIFG